MFACGALEHTPLTYTLFFLPCSHMGTLGSFRGGENLLSPPFEDAIGGDHYVRHPVDPHLFPEVKD